ncbi:MAG: oligosaccharide flippase family protein, partial [bacterium]
MSNKKKNNFVIGAAILSGAGILSRVMGLGYRVVLIRLIGAEGMGIYQMAYPLYTIMLVVSRSGIPVALAKMVAGRLARNKNKDAYRIFTIARILSVVIGLLSSITMALLAGPLISILKLDPRSYYAIL